MSIHIIVIFSFSIACIGIDFLLEAILLMKLSSQEFLTPWLAFWKFLTTRSISSGDPNMITQRLDWTMRQNIALSVATGSLQYVYKVFSHLLEYFYKFQKWSFMILNQNRELHKSRYYSNMSILANRFGIFAQWMQPLHNSPWCED